MPYLYSRPYVYSFCQFFHVLRIFPALSLFRTLEYITTFLNISDCLTEMQINIAGIIILKWKRMKWFSSSNGIQTQHWKVCLLLVSLFTFYKLFTNNVCLYFSTGRLCFHTAFQDPNALDDIPSRQSIEARGICFFPGKELEYKVHPNHLLIIWYMAFVYSPPLIYVYI